MLPSLPKHLLGILLTFLSLLTVDLKSQVLAGFTMPDTVCVNAPIQVVNTSVGASSYQWNFGAFSTAPSGSNQITPLPFSYTTAGTYIVSLILNAGLPDQTAASRPVVVVQQPVADFSFTQNLCNPLSVSFMNGTLGNYSLSWNFGNGNEAGNNKTPTTLYDKYDSYVVKLKAAMGTCFNVTEKKIDIRLQRDEMLYWHDSVQCDDKPVRLQAKAGLNYCWAPAVSLSNSSVAEPVATPDKTTTYFVRSLKLGNNLVYNGDFSMGNTGFSSHYKYTSYNNTEGQYFVGNSAITWNRYLQACVDHTGSSGNMLMINGSAEADVRVWCQSISVTPNVNYVFSAWLQPLHPQNPAKLQFYINDKPVGEVFEAGTVPCNWKQFFMTWNPGNVTTANICVVNKNTMIDGNDFALDDIFFGPVTMVYDSVKLTKEYSPDLSSVTNQTICAGDTARPMASGALFYHWTPEEFIVDPAVAHPEIFTPRSGTYKLEAYNVLACTASKDFNITVRPAPEFSIKPVTIDICRGEQVNITASGATRYTWLLNGKPEPALNGPEVVVKPQSSATYKVAFAHDACGKTDTLESRISVLSRPVPYASVSGNITCLTGGASLYATGGSKYRWYPVEGLSDPEIATPTVAATQTTKYYVEVSNSNCSAIDSVTVSVNLKEDKNLYLVPNSFTPNGDGKNDCFGVKHWGQMKNLSMAIYNRWGQQVFNAANVAECWNGTFKGEQQPPGAYIYVISGTALCGQVLRKGTVLLIR